MDNVRVFFATMAGIPELQERFLQVMQEVKPSETEKMFEKLSEFAKEQGYGEAAEEMLEFYAAERQGVAIYIVKPSM